MSTIAIGVVLDSLGWYSHRMIQEGIPTVEQAPLDTGNDVVSAVQGAANDISTQLKQVSHVVANQWQDWAKFLLVAAIAVLIVLVIHAVVFAIARRAAVKTKIKGDELVVKLLRGPTRLILVFLAIQFVLPTAGLVKSVRDVLGHGLALLLIAAVTWMVVRIIQSIAQFVAVYYGDSDTVNRKARRINTQLRVLSRIASVVAVIVGVAVALMTFPAIRQLGASILASAGITGLIVGLAAQKVIGNFLAGLQIAFTSPINLGDVCVIENEWGRIEEITTTYVVLRIWDERRLIVPFSKIIGTPFYNWTRTNSEVLGTIYFYTDYRVPIDQVRAEVERVVKASPHWDGRACGLVVTGTSETTVELRALISAADGSKQWDLRCEVREKIIKYLQANHPESLPRTRMVIADERAPKSGAGDSSVVNMPDLRP